MQYIYLEVGEEIELRLSADEYRGYSNVRRQCTAAVNYSRYQVLVLKSCIDRLIKLKN